MDISIENGKTVENHGISPDSKCALCKNKFEQESDLRLLIDNSSYGYGLHYSFFCFDCCAEDFPVEVLQACTSIEGQLDARFESESAVLKYDEDIRGIRDLFSVDNIALHKIAIASNYLKYAWSASWEPWVKPAKSSKIRGLAAFKALAYIGDEDAIKEMIEGLSNADLNDRKFISRAMYEIRNPEFTKALKEAKGQDRSPEVNRNIAAAIERHESSDKARKSDALWKKSVKELKEMVLAPISKNLPDDAKESQLVYSMLKQKSKDWVRDFLQILEAGPIQAKMSAVQYLSMEDSKIVTEALSKFKDHEHVGFRRLVRKILIDRGVKFEEDENVKLNKFLNSDDPSLRMMGLSMMQGLSLGDKFLGFVIGLNMFDPDKNVRAKAKSIFLKHASKELKEQFKKAWKANYRTIKTEEKNTVIFEKVLDELQNTQLSLKDICHAAIKSENYAVAAISNLHKTNENCLDIAIPLLSRGGSINVWRIRDGVIDSVSKMGKIAVPTLIESLKDEDPTLVANAARTLGIISSPESVEPLIKSLKHEDSFVRQSSIEALGKISDKKAIEPIKVLIKDESNYVRELAAKALEELGWVPETDEEKLDVLVAKSDWNSITALGSEAVDRLISLLDDEDSEQAANCLGDIGDKRAVEPLIKILPDKSAVVALGKIGDKRAFEALVQVIDESPKDYNGLNTINLAINALVPLNDDRAVDVLADNLVEFSKEGEDQCLRQVLDALGDISDVRAVKPIIEWLDGEVAKIPVIFAMPPPTPLNLNLQQQTPTKKIILENHILQSVGNALGKIGKSALKETLVLLESHRYCRLVSVIALDVMECKPDNDELMALYLVTKEDWNLKCRENDWSSHANSIKNPEEIRYPLAIHDCVGMGDKVIDTLCKILEEFEPFDEDVFKEYRPIEYINWFESGARFYLRVAETLARIGDKQAVEPLKKAGLEIYILWISGDVESLSEIISSDGDDSLSRFYNETAAIALGYVGDESTVELLIDSISRLSRINSIYGRTELAPIKSAEKAIEKIRERAGESVDTDDESNIKMLLESAEHSKVMKGLNKAKEIDLSEEQNEIVLGLKLWNEDPEVRKISKGILSSSDSTLLEKTEDFKDIWPKKGGTRSTYIILKALPKIVKICDELNSLEIHRAMPSVEQILNCLDEDTGKPSNFAHIGEAFGLLEKIGSSQSVIPLIAAFSAGTPHLSSNYSGGRVDSRFRIAIVLGKIGDSRAVKPLIEAFKGRYDTSEDYISKHQNNPSGLGYSVHKSIARGLQESEYNLRVAIAKALGMFGGSQAIEALIESGLSYQSVEKKEYDSGPANVRGYSAEALGLIGDSSAVDPLVKILGDSETVETLDPVKLTFSYSSEDGNTVSTKAIEALVKIGDQRAVEPLVNMLQYGDPDGETGILEKPYWPCGEEKSLSWALENLGWEPDTDERRALCLLNRSEYGLWSSTEDEFTSWGSSAIEPLCNLLKHEHVVVRRNAIEVLGHIGDSRVIAPLTELSQTDEQVSDSAIRALQKRGSEAVPSLIKIAESGDTNAISSLGFMGDSRALKPFTLLLEDDNKEVCKAAIGGFGNLHHENVKIPESVVEKLINLIDSQDKEIRETTITVLGQIGAIQAVEPIIEFLEITIKDEEILDWDNPNHYSYQYAIRALGNIGDKRALDILLKVPNKHYSEVDAVFYALGDLGDKRAVAPLLKILEKEKNPSILNSITQALQKLGHEVE